MRAAAFVLALLAAPALAVDVPQATTRDHRIQRVNYHPDDVVQIAASVGYVSRIVLDPGETIVAAVAGFDDGWSLEPAGHILYVRPLSVPMNGQSVMQPESGEWDTNLVVTTTRRLYDFDLRLVDGEAARTAFYRIEFRYPNDEREQARKEKRAAEDREALERVVSRLPAPRNADYTMSAGEGSSAIAPTLAYDDGRFTYLRFPGNTELPAVFVIGADGAEGVANTHIDPARADVLVVDRVARQLVLRLGRAVVSVYNDAFDARGVSPVDGTTVPGLVRTDAPNWQALDRAQGSIR